MEGREEGERGEAVRLQECTEWGGRGERTRRQGTGWRANMRGGRSHKALGSRNVVCLVRQRWEDGEGDGDGDGDEMDGRWRGRR